MRDKVKKYEIKLENERQERLKLCDKKSSEIQEVEKKAKIQLESMKSARDFMTRDLELAKEALRIKDKKLKEVLGDTVDSPNKRIKLGSPDPYSQVRKRKSIDRKVKMEGVIPHSIDK